MPILPRRAVLASSILLPAPALAQAPWPSRPIRAIVSYPPGGAIDVVARIIAPHMSETLGQPIIVENRVGGTGSIAGAYVAAAPADGYTLLFDPSTHASAPHLVRNLGFSYATGFDPITQLTTVPLILVAHPGVPAGNIAEFLALGRAKAAAGDPLAYASSGNGTASHYATVLFLQDAGWEATHVPFRGGGPAVQALLSGTVAFHIGTAASSVALAQDGRIRALAATTRARLPQLPHTPTLQEAGMAGYEWTEWGGIFAPAGTPAPILDRIHAAAVGALGLPVVRERLAAIGMDPVGSPRAQFAAFSAEQRELVGRLTQAARVTLD